MKPSQDRLCLTRLQIKMSRVMGQCFSIVSRAKVLLVTLVELASQRFKTRIFFMVA